MAAIKYNFISRFIRKAAGFLFIIPFVVIYYCIKLFRGRNKSIAVTGKIITGFTALMENLFLIPPIHSPDEFDNFRDSVKKKFLAADDLYDLEIIQENKDKIEFKAMFCPLAHAFKKMGLPDLAKFACAADWVIAKKNLAFYTFKRDHSNGTDGLPCSHTFIRKNKEVI